MAQTEHVSMESETLTGLFSRNTRGCLTILRDQPAKGYATISFTRDEDSTVADVDAQTLIVPEELFDNALKAAGYSVKAPRGG